MALFPYKRQKTFLHRKIDEKPGGSDTVAEKILGPLDLARADPTAKINFAISQSGVSNGRRLLYICDSRYSDRRYCIGDRISRVERSDGYIIYM